MSVELSVVVPVFCSGPTLGELHARLSRVLEQQAANWELILVDDGSNDGTFQTMQALRAHDPRVRVLRFARNMGQHAATLCGLQRARGRVAVTLDDDLQFRPESIPDLLAALESGVDLVIARIDGRKQHAGWRNVASRIVQRMIDGILGKPAQLQLTSFRAMNRRALDALTVYRGSQVYLPALIFGRIPIDRIANVPVPHDARPSGRSGYTLEKLIALASQLIINHSTWPLRVVNVLGLGMSAASLAFGAHVIVEVLREGRAVPGWASLAVLVALLSGIVLLSLGVLGEYLRRLLVEASSPSQFPVYEEES